MEVLWGYTNPYQRVVEVKAYCEADAIAKVKARHKSWQYQRFDYQAEEA
jgi:hypothetical protein